MLSSQRVPIWPRLVQRQAHDGTWALQSFVTLIDAYLAGAQA